MREELVVDDPFGKLVPFFLGASIDADAPFAVLSPSLSINAEPNPSERTWYLLCSKSVISSIERNQRPIPLQMRIDLASGKLRQIAAFDIVVRLEKDLAKTRFSDWIVLEVELVEAVERIRMRVHV